MNCQTRLLPRLDQLYLQKQSYEAHKKKLTSIRHSGSLSKRSLNQSHINQNQQETKSIQSLSQSTLKLMQLTSAQKPYNMATQHRMETIQQAKPGLSYWLKKMNPLQKRIKQQQIKENKRIREKIKNTMSFVIQSNKLDSHAQHYKGYKNMLNKFQIDHESKRTKLKCEIVLKKISQIEKQKLRLQESRILQFQNRDNSSQRLLKMPKNSQNITKLQNKQKQTPSAKRSRMLSEKINLVTRQSTTTMPNATLLRNASTMKNNYVQLHKDSILTRNKSQFTSKTNSLVRNPKDSKTFTPKIGNSQKYNRIKTQHIPRNDSKRLFNSSKLSNVSSETAPQVKLRKEYKILKVNFTQQGPGFKRVPNGQSQNRHKNQRSSNSKNENDMKNHINSRIRTQVNQTSRAVSLNRESSIKHFDYQKKRIQRYIKSKSSLTVKDISQTNNKYKNDGQINKQAKILEEKRPSIVEENIEESKQTIDVERKEQETPIKIDQVTATKTDTRQEAAYFATEIQ